MKNIELCRNCYYGRVIVDDNGQVFGRSCEFPISVFIENIDKVKNETDDECMFFSGGCSGVIGFTNIDRNETDHIEQTEVLDEQPEQDNLEKAPDIIHKNIWTNILMNIVAFLSGVGAATIGYVLCKYFDLLGVIITFILFIAIEKNIINLKNKMSGTDINNTEV